MPESLTSASCIPLGYNYRGSMLLDPIQCLKDLVSLQKEGELAIQAYTQDVLKRAGLNTRYFDYTPSKVPVRGEFSAYNKALEIPRRALICETNGDPSYPSILIFAHPDSEPVNRSDLWSSDPFVPIEKMGKLYGWGVADDLAGCACAISAIQHVFQDKATKFGNVIFASTPSKSFARGVSALLHDGTRADASLYLHPAESGHGLSEIKAIASGQLEFTLVIYGRHPETTEPGHTAFSHLAVNPIEKAYLYIDALSKLDKARNHRIFHQAIHDEVGRSTNLHISRIISNDEDKLSRINQFCTIGGAVSFPPNETIEDTINEIAEAVRKVSESDPWLSQNPPKLTWLSGVTGGEVDMSSPFYKAVSASVREITLKEPYVNPMHTSSDIKNPIVEADIPCLGLGCLGGNLAQNNQVDEWIDIDDFSKMVAVTKKIIERWCSNEQTLKPKGLQN